MIATREWVRSLGLAIGLVVVLTYPTLPGLLHMGRLETSDGRYSIWNVGWIDHALSSDPTHVLDANIFYPHTGTLAYSELNLVAGVLGLPVYLVTHNAIAALNFAVVSALVLSFMSMWALVRRLTGSSGAGAVAATAFTFCPFVQCHTAHIQLLMVFSLPLTFLAFDRLRERPSWGRAVALGLAVALMGQACAYYGVYGGAALAAAAVLFGRRDRQYWLSLAVALAVAAAVTAPIAVPYLHAREASGAASALARPDSDAYSATWRDYATTPSRADAWLSRSGAECAFPGLVTIGLAIAGLVSAGRRGEATTRRVVRAYAALAGLGVWASFGPVAGLYRFIQVVPGALLLRAPVRLAIVVAFALAVLAGFGARALGTSRRWLAPALVAALALELAAVPWPLVDRGPIPRAYQMLAELPRGPVVEYLFSYKTSDFHNQTHAMLNSTYHWQPLVNGYSDLTPAGFEEMAVPINDFPDPASFELLHKLGVRYIVFDMNDYQGEARDRLLARFPPYASNLRRLTADRDVWLYEIVSWPQARGGE
jgi:hypothetical protein